MKLHQMGIFSLLIGVSFLIVGCPRSIPPTTPENPTNTFTPAVTFTPASTFTVTNTPTKTGTATPTATPTNTGTSTVTRTVTNTATITLSPTATPSATITNTPTITGTPTNTGTPTQTATPTISMTPQIKGWTQLTQTSPFPARCGHATFSLNGQLYVAAGQWVSVSGSNVYGVELNDVWKSSDGANWSAATTAAAFGSRYNFASAVFNNEMWIMGGSGSAVTNSGGTDYDDAWYSTDGANWTAASTSIPFSVNANEGAAAVSFNSKIWIFGGDGYTYSSPDGTTWTKSTSAMPFPARQYGGAVVLNGMIWVFGGTAGTANELNDTWYSSDGANWTEAAATAPFTPGRQNFAYTAFNSQIWLFGGAGLGQPPRDSWFTENGAIWTSGPTDYWWTEISCAVLNNYVYITGGSVGTGVLNTVYESQ